MIEVVEFIDQEHKERKRDWHLRQAIKCLSWAETEQEQGGKMYTATLLNNLRAFVRLSDVSYEEYS